MNSSGIKRGLASLAVSALAVSGLTALSGVANASPIDSLAGGADKVNLLTVADGVASTANDGANTSISLVAAGGKDVRQVRFSYRTATGWTNIATVDRVNGAFSAQWTPAVEILDSILEVRAEGLAATGVEIAGSVDNQAVDATNIGQAVAIDIAAGTEVGAYLVPGTSDLKVAVTGTANTTAVSELGDLVVGAAGAQGIRTFHGVQTLPGYDWEAGTAETAGINEAVLYAGTGAGGDDAVAVKLYKQTVAKLEVSLDRTTLPRDTAARAKATLTVTDQKGAPIAGAQVAQGNDVVGTTNAKGQLVVDALAAGKYTFHVDVDTDAGFQNTKDFSQSFEITSYTQVLTSLNVSGVKAVYDNNELGGASFGFKRVDQNGAEIASTANVVYEWTYTAFPTAAEPAPKPESDGRQTLAANATSIPVPAAGVAPRAAGTWDLKVWVEKDGTPGQGAGDTPATSASFKHGNAKVVWEHDNTKTVQAQIAGSAAVNGKVVLAEDPTVAVSNAEFRMTLGSDVAAPSAATFAPLGEQGAGVKAVNETGTLADIKTGANGSFSLIVKDPAASADKRVTEQRENVALTPAGTSIIDATAVDVDFLTLTVDKVDVDWRNNLTSPGNVARPGDAVRVTGRVMNKPGDKPGEKPQEPLVNTSVELTLDRGEFVVLEDGGVKQTGQAEGAIAGEFATSGKTTTVTTDENGEFAVAVTIGQDDDFNDDFKADVKLTAVAGGVTGADTEVFSSENALNISSITIAHAANQGANGSAILPKVSTDRGVYFDVDVRDQFGNRTNAQVEVAATGANARRINEDIVRGNVAGQANLSLENDNGNLAQAGDLTVHLSDANPNATVWTNVETDAKKPANWQRTVVTDKPAADSDKLVTNWYAVDFEKSTYELTHNGAAENPAGKIVTVTVEATDQEKQPIQFMDWQFYRTGPGPKVDFGDFNGDDSPSTGRNGKASATFQGKEAGTAIVSVIGQDFYGQPVVASEQTTEIVFAGDDATTPEPKPKRKAISVKLKGKNNGKKADRLNAVASADAKGATIRLQRRNAKGKWVAVRTGTVNANGRASFKVKDRNAKKATAYRVRVLKTATTKAAVSPVKRVR